MSHENAISEELVKLGYAIQSTLVRDNFDGREGDHVHEVTIHHNNRHENFEFTSGCAHRHYPARLGRKVKPIEFVLGRMTVAQLEERKKTVPNDPTLEDVMYALLMDANVGRQALSFGEFCDEYGYDEDSRKAYNIFTACQEQYTKLRRLGVDFDALDDLLADF
jgi:hypothetical protein